MAPALTEVVVADPPELWADLGFALQGGLALVDGVGIRPAGADAGRGIVGWAVHGLGEGIAALDGLPVDAASQPPAEPAGAAPHPNGVSGFDHLVLATPDLPRTVDALVGAGLDLRRVRDAGEDRSGARRQQAFFWLGTAILEVVGPDRAAGDGPPQLWGLALTGDLEQAAAFLGDRLRPAKPAVQPGRMIATLDRSAGSTVPVVIMSPHPSQAGRGRTEPDQPR